MPIGIFDFGFPTHFDVYDSTLCLIQQLYVMLTQTGYVII